MSTPTISSSIVDLLRFTRTHLRHHEALMRATGGHFNLFQILGIGHYEVRTHSPILAELLNPQGRHGQGDVFLKLFLKHAEIKENGFVTAGSKVTTEYHIGTKTEDTGGRIDIVLQDVAGRRILIENKIYAGDQENQLTRYSNFDSSAHLLYLTRLGVSPTNFTASEDRKDRFKCISYRDHIRDWLMDCRKEAACLPNVRETISQYIALIEELTHQNTTKEMNENLIKEIIGNKESLGAFFALTGAQREVKRALMEKLDMQLNQIASQLVLARDGRCLDMDCKEGSIGFSNDDLKSLGVSIVFQFEKGSYQSFIFGFYSGDSEEQHGPIMRLHQAFKDTFGIGLSSPGWPAYGYFDSPYRDWLAEAFGDIPSGDLAKNIGAKMKTLTIIARQVCETQSNDLSAIPPQP